MAHPTLRVCSVSESSRLSLPTVCCSNCGFLSGWQPETTEHLIVSRHCRETGIRSYALTRAALVCVVEAADLDAEIVVAGPLFGGDSFAATKSVLHEHRECPKFTPLRPGFTPKEHIQMLLSESVLQLQEQRLREEREHRERQRHDDLAREERWRREDDEREEKHKRIDRQWAILTGTGVAVLTVLLTVATKPWEKWGEQPQPQTTTAATQPK